MRNWSGPGMGTWGTICLTELEFQINRNVEAPKGTVTCNHKNSLVEFKSATF